MFFFIQGTVLFRLKVNYFNLQHIWMPWDEDSECLDWPAQHLENRLHLHFSLVTGTGDQATAIRLDHLMARAEHNRSIPKLVMVTNYNIY